MEISLNKDSNKYINYLPLLPIVLALILSLRNLGSNSLWLDEAWSVAIANLSWGEFWEYTTRYELNMTFYYSILKIWVAFFGDSEFAARSLSVAFSVCAIGMTYYVGVRLFDLQTGLSAGIILAVNAFFIEYSQEVKGYTLYLFMATASSYYFINILENPRLKYCLFYVIISGLMVYNHFFGLLVLLSQALSVPFLCHEKINFKKLYLCMLSITILATPVGLFILFADKEGLGWVQKPSLKILIRLFKNLTGDTGNGRLLLSYFIPCFLGLIISAKRFRESGMTRLFWRYAFLLSWMLIPIAIAFLFSFVQPVFVPRYLITSLIPLVLLVAVGLSKIRNKLLYGVAICGIVCFSVGAVYYDYYPKQKADWRSAVKYVINNSTKGDGIVTYGPQVKLPFEYYYRRINTQKDNLDCIYPSPFGINEISSQPLNINDKFLDAIFGRYERIWCVLWHDINPGIGWDSRPALKKLEEKYIVRNKVFYQDIKIILFERRVANERG